MKSAVYNSIIMKKRKIKIAAGLFTLIVSSFGGEHNLNIDVEKVTENILVKH